MIKNFIAGLFLVIVVIYWVTPHQQVWLWFHKNDAEKYAKAMLDGNIEAINNELFLDYTVSKSGDGVIFSKPPEHENIYLYFEGKNVPNYQNLKWEQIDRNWYTPKWSQ